MPSPLFVVLVVAVGQADDPATGAAARAVEAAMTENTVVTVRESDEARLDEAGAGRLGARLDAGAIVVLHWAAGYAEAKIEVRTRERIWVQRELHFVGGDPVLERGRMVGFDVAAILARPTSKEPVPSTTTTEALAGASVVSAPEPGEAPTPRAPRFAIDALAIAAAGAGATGAGAELASRVYLAGGRLAPRLAVGARFGDLSLAAAHATVLRFEAGLALALVPPSPTRRWGFGVRSDALLLWNLVSRSANVSSGALVVGGATALLEATVGVSRSVTIVLGGGVEAAFGGVDVYVDQRATATIRPVRAVVELGVRFWR